MHWAGLGWPQRTLLPLSLTANKPTNKTKLQVEDVLTYHKQRMKVDKSSHALQLLVGRCVHSEYNGLPQIRKEQVTIFLLENYNTVITIQQSFSDINRRLLARIM
jgi:hypothetical protein